MRILQIYPYYPPAEGFGGVTTVVQTIAKRLAKRNHDSVVYTTDAGGTSGRIRPKSRPVVQEGVTVHYFRNVSNALAYRIPLPIPINFRKAIKRHISEFDAVHIHGYPHLMALFTARVATNQSVPYLLSPHGSVNLPDGVSENLPRTIFERTVGEFVLSNAETVIALTEDEERRLWEAYPSIQKVKQIPNGIDINSVSTSEEAVEHFCNKYGLRDKKLVSYIGRITYKKGVDIIWDVAERFKQKQDEDSQVQFVFVGPDDGMKTRLENIVEQRKLDNISVLGYLSEEEKKSALHAADVFILPSYSEGQPISVLEACAAGTPVVISDQCSIPEVNKYNAGRIITPSSTQLETALAQLLTNNCERELCGQNAKRMINQEFSWTRVIDEYVDLYRCLAGTRHK